MERKMLTKSTFAITMVFFFIQGYLWPDNTTSGNGHDYIVLSNEIVEPIIKEYLDNNVYIRIPEEAFFTDQVDQQDVAYNLSFRFTGHEEEIRFKFESNETLEQIAADSDIQTAVYMILYISSLNIAQSEEFEPTISFLPPESVQQEFGGSVGANVIVPGNSNFSGTYKYVMLTCVYKEDTGAVLRFILFDDPAPMQEGAEHFFKAYYSFTFMSNAG